MEPRGIELITINTENIFVDIIVSFSKLLTNSFDCHFIEEILLEHLYERKLKSSSLNDSLTAAYEENFADNQTDIIYDCTA